MIDYEIIRYDDKYYPLKLKRINNYPEQIYVKGNKELLNQDMFAIIGSRAITKYGKKWAEFFSTEFALRGIPIISGMAEGTDSIAHNISIKYNCPTIAVLGTGINNIYPRSNIQLYNDIIKKGGLIISELLPDEKYICKNFILRNRIISGLSDGILVIEAAKRSGTSTTVNYAMEQEKMVFAIPGRIEDSKSKGTNEFIKKGGKLVTDINDILINYPQFLDKKRKSIGNFNIKSEYEEIYNLIKNNKNSVEEIYKSIKNMSISEISCLLTMMELDDLIEKDFGNGYKIKE